MPCAGHAACEFHVSEQLWPLWLLQGALGWMLFSQAHRLVDSPVFRLGSGTAGFVLLSTLIVAFIIYRSAHRFGAAWLLSEICLRRSSYRMSDHRAASTRFASPQLRCTTKRC